MTYREQGIRILNEMSKAQVEIVKVDASLLEHGNSFMDKIYFEKRIEADNALQKIHIELYDLCSYMIKNNLNWDDETIV